MNKGLHLILSVFCILIISTAGWGQLHLKISAIDGDGQYGVFVQPCDDIIFSGNTITGSGQVTVAMPVGMQMTDLVSHAGTWAQNAVVEGPVEAPGTAYVSVGFISDSPQIIYQPGEETLLFSFFATGSNADSATPSIIDNETDPFAQTPNSMSSNPGNDISVVDFGLSPAGFYYYAGNYENGESICGNVPQDTTVVDDPGEDPGQEPGDGPGTITSSFDRKATPAYFSLSPNPTSEWIKLTFTERAAEKRGDIRLWTSQGILFGQIDKQQQTELSMNLGAMPAGIYFMTFESGGKVLQREAVIKH